MFYESWYTQLFCRGVVFEEEDFQPASYGYRLNPDLSDHRVIGMMREVESELSGIIHCNEDSSCNEVCIKRTLLS